MRVKIHSASSINAQALTVLVESLGFDVETRAEPSADVVLWDLSLVPSRQPPPPSIPTLILNLDNDATLLELLQQGYHGYLTHHDSASTLKDALEAVHRGETWITPSASKHLRWP